MLCGVCWRAPWPTQPAAAGYMALGAWRDLCRLGTVASSSSAGAPFSSCRSCESFTVRRGGGPGWAPPRGAGRPHPPVHPGLSAATAGAGRGELWLLFSPPRLWELGSPGGALAASAGHHPDKLCKGTGNRQGDRTVRARPGGCLHAPLPIKLP